MLSSIDEAQTKNPHNSPLTQKVKPKQSRRPFTLLMKHNTTCGCLQWVAVRIYSQ